MSTRLKAAYSLYNFFHKKELAYLPPLYKRYGIQKKYYSSISSEDLKHLPEKKNWLDVDSIDTATIQAAPGFESFDKDTQAEILNFPEKGYLILRGFYTDIADDVNKEVDQLLDSGKVTFDKVNKIMFGIHKSELLLSLGQNPKLLQVLQFLMGKEISLFSSINFKEGSGQRAHSDEFHMTTYPHANIIAAWIALEDVNEDNGTLFYYPGSHKLPYIMNKDFGNEGNKYLLGPKDYDKYEDRVAEVIEEHNLSYETFEARKGDVLIWHANLLHGGLPVKKKGSTRQSMVMHYYANDAICYHEIKQRPTLFKYRTS